VPPEQRESVRLEAEKATRHLLSIASVPYLLLGSALLVLIVMLGISIEHHINGIELWFEKLGNWGMLVFVLLYVVLTTLLLPESVLAMIAGALFGMIWGPAVVIIAALLAAALQYCIARYTLTALIQRTLGARPALALVQRAVLNSQLRLQLLIRLMPVNPSTVSYVLGAAGVRFGGYLLASLALTPHLLLEVWAGYTTRHIARLAGTGSRTADDHDLFLISGLIITAATLIMLSRIARRAFIEAAAQMPAAGEPTAG